jgi:hypothetical protein
MLWMPRIRKPRPLRFIEVSQGIEKSHHKISSKAFGHRTLDITKYQNY